jgi:hypothetical protein
VDAFPLSEVSISFVAFATLCQCSRQDTAKDDYVRSVVVSEVTMKTMKKREKWVLVRDTTAGGDRIYHRF